MGCILDRISDRIHSDLEPTLPPVSDADRIKRLAAANRDLVQEIRRQDRHMRSLRDFIQGGDRSRIPQAERAEHAQALLALNGPQTTAELAALMQVTVQRVVQILAPLVDIGLVRRRGSNVVIYDIP